MSDTFLMWVEIGFNVSYLAVIWVITAMMFARLRTMEAPARSDTGLIAWGFFLLALGDTGHVGFRVIAYAMGGLGQSLSLFGTEIPLAGIGSLATAYTVTVLYMLLALYWRRVAKPGRAGTAIYWVVQALAILRLVIMAFPQNQWASVTPPALWGVLRNIPLTIAGVAIGVLYFIVGRRRQIRSSPLFTRLGIYIFLSYAFYLPVILFVRQVPVLGMLMIPKTIMYLLMAGDCYRTLFTEQ